MFWALSIFLMTFAVTLPPGILIFHTVLQTQLAISNLWVLYIYCSFCLEYLSPFAIGQIFLRNCMPVKLFLAPLFPGRINHSLLCSTSVYYIYLFRCFLCTLSHFLGSFIPAHDCSDNFCEDAVRLHAGTVWQRLASGLCSFTSHWFPPPPLASPMDSLLDGEVAWDTSGILLSNHACATQEWWGVNALGEHPWLVKSRV